MKKDERFKKYVSKVTDKRGLDKKIEDPEHIKRIAEGLSKWETYCYEFQLTRDMAKDIKEKYDEGLHQRIEVLYTWMDKDAGRHTYKALLKICSDCEMANSAGVIVSILNKEFNDRKAKERHHKFLSQCNLSYLDNEITDEDHIRRIAHDLSKWKENSHRFDLSWKSDVSDIHKQFKEPERQRIEVINKWIDKNKPDATYGALLQICAYSEMSSSASTIVDITKEESHDENREERKAFEDPSSDEESSQPPVKKFKQDIDKQVLTNDDFSTLCEQLRPCRNDWERIAIGLGFKPDEIDDIKKNTMIVIQHTEMEEVIKYWLRWGPGDKRKSKELPTVQALQDALNNAIYARIKIKV